MSNPRVGLRAVADQWSTSKDTEIQDRAATVRRSDQESEKARCRLTALQPSSNCRMTRKGSDGTRPDVLKNHISGLFRVNFGDEQQVCLEYLEMPRWFRAPLFLKTIFQHPLVHFGK